MPMQTEKRGKWFVRFSFGCLLSSKQQDDYQAYCFDGDDHGDSEAHHVRVSHRRRRRRRRWRSNRRFLHVYGGFSRRPIVSPRTSKTSKDSVLAWNLRGKHNAEKAASVTRRSANLIIVVVRIKNAHNNFNASSIRWTRELLVHVQHPVTHALVSYCGNAVWKA